MHLDPELACWRSTVSPFYRGGNRRSKPTGMALLPLDFFWVYSHESTRVEDSSWEVSQRGNASLRR